MVAVTHLYDNLRLLAEALEVKPDFLFSQEVVENDQLSAHINKGETATADAVKQ